MHTPYRVANDDAHPFSAATAFFSTLRDWLESTEAIDLRHHELEEQLEVDGRELMRLLLQGHLHLRAQSEERRESVQGADGAQRTHVRPDAERGLMTVFGPVRVRRFWYSGRGVDGLAPADAALSLPAEAHSFGVRRQAAQEAIRGSYDDAVGALGRNTAARVGKRQVEKLVVRAAQDFDAFYENQAAKDSSSHDASGGASTDSPHREGAPDILALSMDGKGIVMRPEALREPTRKAAEQTSKKLGKRLSRGEKGNRKRMATVASVYDVAPHCRTAEDVMSERKAVSDADTTHERPRARNKRVWASVEKSAEAVTQEVFAEAAARDADGERRWVVLVDGDRQQIARVQAEAARRQVDVTVVVDFVHVLEYVWKAAWCFFEEGNPDAETWVAQRATSILRGKSTDVGAGIRRSATLMGLKGNQRKGADACADYLIAKRPYLRYDRYLADGLPIATGVIEGACRHLVKDRMDITGARWGLTGAEAVLRLRSIRSSGDFDAYWKFHLHREHARNHPPSTQTDCVMAA